MKQATEKYIVISKNNVPEPSMGKDWAGRRVLMSFASKPLWKPFRYIFLQRDTLPNYWDKDTAQYAFKKYANSKDYEVLAYKDAVILFNTFKKDNKLI